MGVRSGSAPGERKGRHARPEQTRNGRLIDRAWANSRQSPRIRTAHAKSTRSRRMTRCGYVVTRNFHDYVAKSC